MRFKKMHGLGNDFVIVDQREVAGALDAARIKQICDRHRGIGCDQLIIMEPSSDADLFMRIYNPDASESGACGNATRCVAHIYMEEENLKNCKIETKRGVLMAHLRGHEVVEVDMGQPQLDWASVPLSYEIDVQNLQIGSGGVRNPVAVGMGNPHCVFFVDDVDAVDIHRLGSKFETHDLFPQSTNVEFVQVIEPNKLRVRVWERGAGITQACGSGACASVVAAVQRGLTDRTVEIVMDGGSLSLEWSGLSNHVLMTGPVTYVFEGSLRNV